MQVTLRVAGIPSIGLAAGCSLRYMSSLQADAAAAAAQWAGPGKKVNMLLCSKRFSNAPVAGTEGGSGEMSGRQVPPGCALAETGRTLVGRWIRASATWGRAPPGLREGGGSVGGCN